MKILCNKCHLELTSDLIQLFDKSLLSTEDKEPLIPPSYFYITEASNKILANLGDLKNIKNHPNNSRLNGCCGLDGEDGINTVCSNGHEVGTTYSDCWMPHYISFEPDNVELINSIQFLNSFNS